MAAVDGRTDSIQHMRENPSWSWKAGKVTARDAVGFKAMAPDGLVLLVEQLSRFMWAMHRKRMVATCWMVGRKTAPHADMRALDLRTKHLRPEEIMAALDFVNDNWPWPANPHTGNPWRLTLIYESPTTADLLPMLGHPDAVLNESATATHLHLQVPHRDLGEIDLRVLL